jgi:hypothetical protein
MIEKKENDAQTALNMNTQLNTPWIDTINFAVREDNLCLLRFLTNLPEGIYEQSRIMISKETFIGFIDLFCSQIDYYPVKNEIK